MLNLRKIMGMVILKQFCKSNINTNKIKWEFWWYVDRFNGTMQRYIINPNPPASLENYWKSFFKLCWSLLYTCKYDGVCIIRNILSDICCIDEVKVILSFLANTTQFWVSLGQRNCLLYPVWVKPEQPPAKTIIWLQYWALALNVEVRSQIRGRHPKPPTTRRQEIHP